MKSNKKKTKDDFFLAVIGKCSGCHYCVNVCPQNAITENTPPTIDNSKCTRCMKCIEACPRDLIKTVQ